jgi:dipeptidyl aminopeptidase/acylaminoacyl peptidase
MSRQAGEEVTDMSMPPLIPRDDLFGNPRYLSPEISPDGSYLAYIAPDERNVRQIFVRTPGKTDDRPVTAEPKRGILLYGWAHRAGQLVYLQDTDGDENYHLYLTNVESSTTSDLTPFDGITINGIHADADHPDHLLIGMNRRDPALFDIHRINLSSGDIEVVAVNPGHALDWLADATMTVRIFHCHRSEGGFEILHRRSNNDDWKTLITCGPDDECFPQSFSRDGDTLYLRENTGADAHRLIAHHLPTGKRDIILAGSPFDVGDIIHHPVTRELEAAVVEGPRNQWTFFDNAMRRDHERFAALRAGEVRIVSRTVADDQWTVAIQPDDGPTHYYLYDRVANKAALLFTNRPQLERANLAKHQPMRYAARDGLTIHGYLSLPPGVEANQLPTVLLVHGGPWHRDRWGFDTVAQWLANRGYAVLQVNFRGSTGFGREHLTASYKQWGAAMHNDLIDAVDWLKAQGIADPDRIGIMGGSYGGYATLAGLTFTPEVFACGVDIVGISNLVTFIESIPPYWKPMMSMLTHRVGDPDTERAMLEDRSPLNHAHRICRPLLIGQGANDPRVKQAESDQIVAAMRERDIPVEYVVYTDEGHGFGRPANMLHFFAMAEQFLAKHLGGRCEPVGRIEGHSGELR